MDDFLTPVSTTKVKRTQDSKPLLKEIGSTVNSKSSVIVDSPERALEVLKEQPDLESIESVLEYLVAETERQDGFHLVLPGPVAANIVFQLINTTLQDYWQILKDKKPQLKQMTRCLRNPSGIGNVITRLRPLIADCRQKKAVGETRDSASHIVDLLDFLERILHGEQCLTQVWADIKTHGKNAARKKMMWKEFVAQVASGRIVSLAAEAEDVLKEKQVSRKSSWLADGSSYATWLGRNIAHLSAMERDEDSASIVVDVCSKALTLGYTDQTIRSMLLVMIDSDTIGAFTALLHKMKAFEQRKYLNAIINALSNHYFNTVGDNTKTSVFESSPLIAGVAALVSELVRGSDTLMEHLVASLTRSGVPALDDSLSGRRSVIAAIAKDEDHIHTLLENSLKMFGDTFYIKHTPIIQQEALAQTLAITCGYVQRSQPMFLTMMAKSSHHTSGMSNRIGSSSPRARFLGIAMGMAISKMVDKPETQLNFDLEGAEAEEAQWYQHLTKINDRLGEISFLKVRENKSNKQGGRKGPTKVATKDTTSTSITEIQGPRIVEILSDEDEDEDDDLVPYSKPDSDPEDETDDPTEINRNKPTAPVYIRDLVAGLRDTEDYDRHALALSTAAPLIRRKANFGSEVLDNIEELASILVGLNDSFELEKFAEQKQQALIAVLLAKPAAMAQWFARNFFTGDYSLTQRTAILTTLGLGARELAGLKDTATENMTPPAPAFPSKKLPPQLHALYAPTPSSSNPLARLTTNMTKELLSPLAAKAADTLTGPAILKVGQSRTFSSRMEVEARRSKPIPNALSQMVVDNFFFPLTGRWWLATRASASSASSIYTSTHLLPTFLHTLALLMNASGPNTLALPQMTREMWELLLSCRAHAMNDKRILSALLFAVLMLLETNGDKERLATEQGKELMETQEWVRGVFDGLPAGKDGGEDEKVRVLAAGVVVRCQEVVEKYQRRLVGSMMDY
ncbi:telomere binding protein [Didymosphaeria variabile]|uniref:Telomere binding protein n=1 Tax=Didymosphaeria variabile TaxID=1932322 RepID=A0A9W8XAZ5_9PLEO|nr:telomere binding protein [Didymosphaeria variabile]KAJ4345220.1 telomere binding protein [Didymosphaeria variabile]